MGEFKSKFTQYNNNEIARYLLIEQAGVILGVESKESRLCQCAYDYIFNGNKNRSDYEYLVKQVFNHHYDEWCVRVLLDGGVIYDK